MTSLDGSTARRAARQTLPGRLLLGLAAAAALGSSAGQAVGAEPGRYPSQPIRMIVPFGPGTQIDTVARLLGTGVAESVGQPIVVENRPGASGNIAAESVAKATPDGHTVLIAGATITLLPSTMGARAVDPLRSLAPVTKLTSLPLAIGANSSLGVGSLGELIARARREPGRLPYSTAGIGSSPHLAAELLWSRAGVELLHVPYVNAAQTIADTLTGAVPISVTVLPAWVPFLKDERLRVLAVMSPRRSPLYPDIPTVAESGFPGFDVTSWYGVLAPAGTPTGVIARLQAEFSRVLRRADVQARLATMGMEPVGGTSEAFTDEIKTELGRWPPVVNAAGIRAE